MELLTQELEKSDALLEKYKKEAVEGEQDKTKIENLVRTKQLLEEELDTAEKNHKDTVSRSAVYLAHPVCILTRLLV